jgi:hypothetical protein
LLNPGLRARDGLLARRTLGGPRRGARGRAGGLRDDENSRRQRRSRAGEVPLAGKRGRQSGRAGEHAGYPPRRIREDIDTLVAGLQARGAELVGELERYENRYRLCYIRGPEGIIIELAEQIG